MTILLSCKELTKAHGTRTLFKNLSFGVFEGEKLGVIGTNGTGKTTLMRICAGLESPDSGEVVKRQHLKIGYVPQDPGPIQGTLQEVLLHDLAKDPRELYEKEILIEIHLSKAGFQDQSLPSETLSGGQRKRLEIVRQIIRDPELLLLDEPTNHLDLEGILWLEEFLSKQRFAYLIVSHDRVFLNNTSENTLELGPQYAQGLFKVDVPFFEFIALRDDFLAGQKAAQQALSSKVRREVAWLRTSPKARTTKSHARIQQAEEWISELKSLQQRNRQKRADIDFTATERETRKLISLKNVAYAYDARELFKGLECTLSPRSRLGLMGPNGSGKTTLLRLIAQELKPTQGTIKYADDLRIVYFDQHRFALPKGGTLKSALSPHGDFVRFRGQDIHVNGWCRRFLFSPDLLDMPLSALSGGEKARLLIAKLMLEPADILLLDEPTNDLDIPTLEILEENLQEFPGAIVLITHDRYLLARVCNQILSLGTISPPPHFADYAHFEKWQREREKPSTSQKAAPTASKPAEKKQKISWKEQKESEDLENKILRVEEKIAALHLQINDPSLQEKPQELHALCKELQEAESKLIAFYTRWSELNN